MNVIMAEPAKWDSFYVIVWSAAGALIGLQFIVLTLIAQRSLHKGAMKTGAAFATPTIVHFGVSLLLSALLRASWQKIGIFAAVLSFIGFSGVAYVGIIALRIIRESIPPCTRRIGCLILCRLWPLTQYLHGLYSRDAFQLA